MKTQTHKSVANKIVTIMVVLLVITFAISGIIINSRLTKVIEEMEKEDLRQGVGKASADISTYLTEKVQIVHLMSESENIIKYTKACKGIKSRSKVKEIDEYDSVLKSMNNINDGDDDVSLVYVALKDSSCFITQDRDYVVDDDFDLEKRAWYTDAVAKNETHITSPYLDLVSGGLVISAVTPIYDDGKDIGATAIDVSIDKLSDILSKIKIADGNKAFLIDSEGTFVYHPDEAKIMNEKATEQEGDMKDVARKMIDGELGIDEIILEGEKTYMSYSPIELSGWSVGIAVPEDYVKAKAKAISMFFLLVYALALIIISLGVYIVSKHFFKPTKKIVESLDKMSKYILNEEINIKSNDEFGLIANSLISMQTGLKEMMENISAHAQNTAATAEELTATAQSTNESARELASSVGNIAEGASSQAEDTQSAAGNVELSNSLLNDMVSVLGELSDAVNDINSKKNEGKVVLNELLEISNQNQEEVGFIEDIISKTNESAEAISKASEMIQSIADQTNLLALNAAIEAARAGEAGKGFAVVADEIRKLAEDSTKFTGEIRKIINGLKEKTENAVHAMDGVGKKMAEQGEKASLTQDKFEDIEKAVNKSNEIVSEVSKSTKEIEEKNNILSSVVQNLSAIAEENAATTEEASATVDTQTASISDISSASENLAKIATELQEEVMRFKL